MCVSNPLCVVKSKQKSTTWKARVSNLPWCIDVGSLSSLGPTFHIPFSSYIKGDKQKGKQSKNKTQKAKHYKNIKISGNHKNRGRMFKSGKVLLVLVCEIHIWVSCFLYSLEICCYHFLHGVFLSWGIKVKRQKTWHVLQIV